MKKKKVIKTIAFIAFLLLVAFFIYQANVYFRTGKQIIYATTSTEYDSHSDLQLEIKVQDNKRKAIKSNVTVELLDSTKEKVKDVKEKLTIEEEDKQGMIAIKLPEDLASGQYYAKITAKSGIKKDVAEVPVTILKDKESNITVSFDKGIYKPGDEVQFRALITAKSQDEPVQTDVKLAIYDGNANKVYTEQTKTSEYGIVSGSFTLSDEVNSGTYKLVVSTENKELTKNFIVNPYVTPQFEVTLTTDKEAYIVQDNAQITVQATYFFGEPVTNADVVMNINDNEIKGLTDAEGKFTTNYQTTEKGNVAIDLTVTDSSNYAIEAEKTVSVGTDLFEIDILPEYEKLIKGMDNDVYVITNTANGEPVKTYVTINNGKLSRQVITDENGIGKFTLSKSELTDWKMQELDITATDMNGNQVKKSEAPLVVDSNGTIVKTNQVKYKQGDDIEVEIKSSNDVTENEIYIYKGKQLLQMFSFEGESTKLNLEDTTGLVDIYIKDSTSKQSYSKRTIFIEPSKALNIAIQTDNETYAPGDTLNMEFTTTDENNNAVDSAMLVSILDEAVLSLAENDLSIDSIKLALEDITLTEGVTAADLYASVLNDSSDMLLYTTLLRQGNTNPSLKTTTYRNYDASDAEEKCILSGIAIIICVAAFLLLRHEKLRKVVAILLEVLAVATLIFGCLMLVIDNTSVLDFLYYNLEDLEIFILSVALAVILYASVLYKHAEYIFKLMEELIIAPVICLTLLGIIGIIFDSEVAVLIALLIMVCLFALLKVRDREGKLGKSGKAFIKFLICTFKGAIFWFIARLILGVTDFGIFIALIVYVLYDYFILGKKKTKSKDGITIHITTTGVTMTIIGIVVLLVIGKVILNSASSTRNSSGLMYNDTIDPGFDIGSFSQSSSNNSGGTSSIDTFAGSQFATNEESKSTNTGIDSFTEIFDRSDQQSINSTVTEEEVSTTEATTPSMETETEENVRNVFLESLAFIPELVTENGTATTSLKLSDNITTWNIQTVGNTKNGRIGYASSSFKVFKEFFVDFTLPTNSVVSDKISIPVTVYNYTEGELTVEINVKEASWCKIGEYTKNVTVPAGGTNMVYVPIELLEAGANTLRIETKADSVSDIVEKTMEVSIKGMEKEEVVSSGSIENKMEQDIIFNENAIEGTKNLKIKLYPSTISQVMEGMENILKMPTGCFEQTSSSLYPDILVLKYLKENDLSNEAVEKKALEYISKGYQKLLTYEVHGTQGGYSLYGDAPAEPVITAFGLMEMQDLSEVYDIDEKVIENMKEYLFKVQKSNGSFDYKSTYIGSSASTTDLAMNAYIIWALSEVCPEDSRLEKSVNYLEKNYEDATDTYTLALIANVFANTGNSKAKTIVNQLMDKVTTEDNERAYLSSSSRDYYGTYGKYQNVQATALTSMALTKLDTNAKTNANLINYIISCKDSKGTWSTTQSTILALKAINDFNEKSDIGNQTITVTLNGETQTIEIGEDNLDLYEINFADATIENKLKVEMKKGRIYYEIVKEYAEPYENVEKGDSIEVTQEITTALKVNDTIQQNIHITNTSDDIITNGIVVVNIPQGASVVENSLLALEYDKKIEKYEYNYGTIQIYLRNVKKDEPIDLTIEYKANYPVNVTGGAIHVYDYYNPEIEGICLPVNIVVTE